MATRWGILSAGKISHDFVTCLNMLSSEEHEVVAIGARDLQKARNFAASHGIAKAYGSYEEVSTDPDVEIVYVGVINTQHFPTVKHLLQHGKHVLCEKPLSMSAADTREMVALARSTKRFLMEAIWSRCFPTYERLRQELEAGTLGKVVQVKASFCRKIDHVARVADKQLGGGTTLDLGVYPLQLASLVFGGRRPLKVVATGHTNESGADEAVVVGLKYDNGQLACLNYSAKAAGSSDATILGTRGEIKLAEPFWCCTEMTLPGGQVYRVDLPKVGQPLSFIHSEGLAYEAQEVRKCLKAGLLECPLLKHEESILLAELMDEIMKQVCIEVQ